MGVPRDERPRAIPPTATMSRPATHHNPVTAGIAPTFSAQSLRRSNRAEAGLEVNQQWPIERPTTGDPTRFVRATLEGIIPGGAWRQHLIAWRRPQVAPRR